MHLEGVMVQAMDSPSRKKLYGRVNGFFTSSSDGKVQYN